jgi:PKD repeat protein
MYTHANTKPPVASFKSWNIEDIGADQPTIIEGHHMVGGQIEFDARESSDPAGGTLTYYWDFGDGTQETTLNPVILKVYTKPEKFTVTLSVKNNKGISSTNTASEELDLSLNPGDLLVIRSGWPYAQIFDFFGLTYTHVGMYVGKIDGEYRVVESTFSSPPLSHKIGVQETPIERWGYPHETYVDVVRVTNDPEIATRAVAFARGLALDPHPHIYDTTLGEKQIDCSSLCPYCLCDQYYCSELVWAAYYRASDGAIDLSADAQKPLLVAVSPDDIFNYPLSTNVGWHHEKYPPKNVGAISISVLSPVDISVTDPSGLTITKESSQIIDAAYVETDLDEDNDIDDVVIIPEPKLGDYLILVIPEPNALPADTYSLEAIINGQTMVLAQDVQIQNIPSEPYIIESKLNPADFDNDGDVDFYDYAAFASRWMSADCHYPDWCEGKDLDYSGLVDFMDLAVFTENWLWAKIPADIDIDGNVDFADFVILANHWMNNCVDPHWCDGCDFDKSGSVDVLDLAELAQHWLEGI